MRLRKPPVGARLDTSQPLGQGVVACYLMNEAGGLRLVDISGRGNHGQLTSFAHPSTATSGWKPGAFGPALYFDGSDDYVPLTRNSGLPILRDTTNPYSIAYWVKCRGTAKLSILFAERGTTARIFHLAGVVAEVNVRVYNDSGVLLNVTGSLLAYDEAWHSVVWVDNGGTCALYVDGKLDPTSFNYTRSGTFTMLTDNLGAYVAGDNHLVGLLDNVRLYERALTHQEARELFVNPFAGISGVDDYESDFVPAAAPGGTVIPVFRHHYVQQGVA